MCRSAKLIIEFIDNKTRVLEECQDCSTYSIHTADAWKRYKDPLKYQTTFKTWEDHP